MKKIYYITLISISLLFSNCTTGNSEDKTKAASSGKEVKQLTTEAFKKLVFNYDVNKEWKYEGNMPAIIDFYADWCPPCRQLSPLVEEIAGEYQGKIVVYRVNTDQEKMLTQSLGIANLPTVLYIPLKGKPQVTLGYIPKDEIVKTINAVLLTK